MDDFVVLFSICFNPSISYPTLGSNRTSFGVNPPQSHKLSKSMNLCQKSTKIHSSQSCESKLLKMTIHAA